jgi:hypothetical protein
VSHVFYAEESQNFQLCLKLLRSIKKRLVETTLLDAIDRPGGHGIIGYKKLENTLTTRCCVYDNYRCCYTLKNGKKLIPVTKESDKNLPMKLWDGYCYLKRGNESLNNLRDNPLHESAKPKLPLVPLLDKTENIKNWRVGISKDLLEIGPTDLQEPFLVPKLAVQEIQSASPTGQWFLIYVTIATSTGYSRKPR